MGDTHHSRHMLAGAREAVSWLAGWIESNGIATGAQAPLPGRTGYPKGVLTVVRPPAELRCAAALFYEGHVLTGSGNDNPGAALRLAYQLGCDPAQEGVRRAFQVSSNHVLGETAEADRQAAWRREDAETLHGFKIT